MRILTVDNQAFNLNTMPDRVDDLRYCVLDYSDKDNIDYYWPPLVFLDIFHAPCADLRIGTHNIQMPLDWHVVVGDKHAGDLEVCRLVDIMDKQFQTFAFNPIGGFMPDFLDVEIENVFADVKWCFPKLKVGHFLAVPVELKPNPACVYFIKDVGKNLDVLDIREMV